MRSIYITLSAFQEFSKLEHMTKLQQTAFHESFWIYRADTLWYFEFTIQDSQLLRY